MQKACQDAALRDFGIEVTSFGVTRLGYPAQNLQSVFARMRAERERIARGYRSEGKAAAQKIRAEADRERSTALANAEAEAQRLKGEGEAEAARVYADAYRGHEDFYRFLRTLESYEKVLQGQHDAGAARRFALPRAADLEARRRPQRPNEGTRAVTRPRRHAMAAARRRRAAAAARVAGGGRLQRASRTRAAWRSCSVASSDATCCRASTGIRPGRSVAWWSRRRRPTSRCRSAIGCSSSRASTPISDLWLTGDTNVVTGAARHPVQRASSLTELQIAHEAPRELLRRAGERVLSRVSGLGRRRRDPTTTQAPRADRVRAPGRAGDPRRSTASASRCQAVSVQELAPPLQGEVRSAFQEVQNANADRERAVFEARAYKAQVVAEAQGEAQRRVAEATGDRHRRIEIASGEAERFAALAREHDRAPGVTEERLYLETLERVLPRLQNYVVEPGPGGKVNVRVMPMRARRAALLVAIVDARERRRGGASRCASSRRSSRSGWWSARSAAIASGRRCSCRPARARTPSSRSRATSQRSPRAVSLVEVGGGTRRLGARAARGRCRRAPQRLDRSLELPGLDPLPAVGGCARRRRAGDAARAALDPHVWLDPIRVRDALVPALAGDARGADPDRPRETTRQSRDAFVRGSARSTPRSAARSRDAGRRFVAFHGAWRYFAAALRTRRGRRRSRRRRARSRRRASSARWRRRAREARVPAILVEPQLRPRVAQMLAAELGVDDRAPSIRTATRPIPSAPATPG